MPELPEVTVFTENLHKKVKDKKIKNINVHRSKNVNVTQKKLTYSLENHGIDKVFREGKEIHIEFKNGEILAFHLMLDGEMYLFEDKNEHEYSIIELEFKDDTGLVLTDPRKFAKATLNPEKKEGVDALSDEMNVVFLKEKLAEKRAQIKNFLTDQDIIQGIGNIYSDEILWDAGISPFSICNKIPEEKIEQLADSIKKVLKDAIENIKEEMGDAIHGEHKAFFKIHNSDKDKSPTGEPIKTKKSGSQKTYYTEKQELFD